MKKSEITSKLNTLKKVGWKIYTLNSHHAMPVGMIGLPDHILFYPRRGITVWCEVKIGADHMKPRQIEFKSMITSEKYIDNNTIYCIITDKNVDEKILYLAGL